MSNQDRLVAEILQRLAEAIGKGDINTISRMHQTLFGSSERVVAKNIIPTPSASPQAAPSQNQSATETEDLRKKFEGFPSRDALQNHLSVNYKTKTALVALAKKLGIPVKSSDNAKAVANKIVNDTVGARLQTGAIRGA